MRLHPCFFALPLLAGSSQGATWAGSTAARAEISRFHQTEMGPQAGTILDTRNFDDSLEFAEHSEFGDAGSSQTSSRTTAAGAVGARSEAQNFSASGSDTRYRAVSNVNRQLTFIPTHPGLAPGTVFQTTLSVTFHGNFSAFASETVSHGNGSSALITFGLNAFDSTIATAGYGRNQAASFVANFGTRLSEGSISNLREVFGEPTLFLYDTSVFNGAPISTTTVGASTVANPGFAFANNGDSLYNAGQDVSVTVNVPMNLRIGQEFGFEYGISTSALADTIGSFEGFPGGQAWAIADALNTASFSLMDESGQGIAFAPTGTFPVPESRSAVLALFGMALLARRRRAPGFCG